MSTLEDLIAALPHLTESQRPAPYPHAAEGAIEGQDELYELGAKGDAPRSGLAAVRLGREWIAEERFVGVGYCLRTIRSLYGVNALYPDAETAWENTDHRHHTTDPAAIPFWVPIWWTNGRYGHVALSLGDGRCLTTDYIEPGLLGVASISALGPWCGGRLRGWSWDLNNVVVWRPETEPDQDPEPTRWTLEDRERFLRRALSRAQRNGKQHRIDGLERWLKHVQDNRKKA